MSGFVNKSHGHVVSRGVRCRRIIAIVRMHRQHRARRRPHDLVSDAVATHRAVRANGQIQIVTGDAKAAVQVEFMVLHEGRIHFRGTAEQLCSTPDRYLREFLFRTLPPW